MGNCYNRESLDAETSLTQNRIEVKKKGGAAMSSNLHDQNGVGEQIDFEAQDRLFAE